MPCSAEAYTCPGSSATAAAATPAPSADLGKPEVSLLPDADRPCCVGL